VKDMVQAIRKQAFPRACLQRRDLVCNHLLYGSSITARRTRRRRRLLIHIPFLIEQGRRQDQHAFHGASDHGARPSKPPRRRSPPPRRRKRPAKAKRSEGTVS
jgi:hypothetical protein